MQNRNRFSLSCNFIIGLVIFISLAAQVNASSIGQNQIQTKQSIIHTETNPGNAPTQQKTTPAGQSLYAQINKDLRCLALNIYFEARSEPNLGGRAVGHVVMNRAYHAGFPNSVCDVVRQGGARVLNRCQFSWWCDGQTDQPYDQVQWARSLQLAFEIYSGKSQDPTGGALWYHADYVNPYWSRVFHRGPQIGRHIFYQEAQPLGNLL